MFTDQRDKNHITHSFTIETIFGSVIDFQFLILFISGRNDHPSTNRQLIREGFGDNRSASGNDYLIERCILQPSASPITDFKYNVGIAHLRSLFLAASPSSRFLSMV